MKLQPLRGMRDIVEPDSTHLYELASRFRRIAGLYGYREIITPTLERFELFALKSGEEIRKTMYVFTDKAGREVALRPEVTASVARAYLRLLRGRAKPLRLMYIANCFRYDEPQRARYREFFQAGAELIGSGDPESDVELLLLLDEYYSSLGLRDYRVKMDDVGIHRAIMRSAGISEEMQDRILHLMDKDLHDEALREARRYSTDPSAVGLLEYLVENRRRGLEVLRELSSMGRGDVADAAERLRRVVEAVGSIIGMERIVLDLGFARGLAYYTGMIYEIIVPGMETSVAGGGRYDGLIELYGGEPTPATGFAIGLDRTLLALKERGLEPLSKPCARVLVVPLSSRALPLALRTIHMLHSKEIAAELYHGRTRRLKKTLSFASEQGYSHVVIIGDKEVEENLVTLRDMESRAQRSMQVEEAVDTLRHSCRNLSQHSGDQL